MAMTMRNACLLFGLALVSCKSKGGGDYSDRSSPAAEAKSAGAGSAAGDDKSAGKDGKSPTTWKRSQIVPNSSRVMVGDREELALRTMQTHVSVDGFRARVVIDYVYANDRDHMLEGTFQLRLPEGASPYYFAFGETRFEATAAAPDLKIASADNSDDPRQIAKQREGAWLAPKEARMVPRETAAIAYGQTVRRRVDPAIVEWAGAGVFTARIYPVMPHRLHRVVVGYDLDLTPIGSDLELAFDLPEQVPQSTVEISVADAYAATSTPAVKPTVRGSRKVFAFADQTRSIQVRLAKPGAVLLTGSDPQAGEFFAARAVPQLPIAPAATADAATFLVDTSLSSNPDRFNIYLTLLRAVLDKNRDSLKTFNVLFFSVDAHWYSPQPVANTPANVDAVLAFANTLALEGATDLGAALAEAAHHGKTDLFLLSDGAATWGQGNLHALGKLLAGTGALFAYQTGLAGTDTSALVHLARESGGAVFSVTGEAEIDKAATAHRARPWRLTSVEVTGGTDVLVAGTPTVLFPGQTVHVAGRGQIGAAAVLTLTLEQGGKTQVVKTTLGAPLASPLTARTYGSIATAHLEELESATELEARAYATHFRITGRTCSLLMLESEADYARFNIKPDADAYVVKATPAGPLFAKALAQTLGTLGDPKAAFVALLDKLARSPHVKLQLTPSYKTAIDQLPAAVFAVPATPLATRLRGAKDVSPALLEALRTHKLEYDLVTAAALARKGQGTPGDVLKGLSSLVEENPGDAVLARDVGFSAMELGLGEQAYHLFRRVAEARPYEPQTYRAIGQALVAMGKLELALAYYEIPLMGTWDPRFGELQAIVELEYLRLLRRIAQSQSPAADYARARLPALAQKVGIDRADLVVTITWNTDNTDVDLHVVEPSGEEVFYAHSHSESGGRLTRDVTQGYGPEMYVLREAPTGTYQIDAVYFASDQNRASVRSKVGVTLIEDWGKPTERVTDKVVTLEYGRDRHAIATVKR